MAGGQHRRGGFWSSVATLIVTLCVLFFAPSPRGAHDEASARARAPAPAPAKNASRFAPCSPPNPTTCDGVCGELLKFILKERAASSWNAYYEDVAAWVHRHGLGGPDNGGVLVEVGTAYGGLTRYLLDRFPTLHVHAVDPFVGLYDGGDHMSNLFDSLRKTHGDADFPPIWARALAFDAGQAAGCRYRLIRDHSASAAARYPRRSVDMIFIDGDHTRGGVDADIAAWAPVVKLGRAMLFNDYQHARWPGVVGAVDAHAERTGQVVQYLPQQAWGNVAIFNLPELYALPPDE